MDAPGDLQVELKPRWPIRLPMGRSADGTIKVVDHVVHRLIHVGAAPVLVRLWHRRSGEIALRAEPAAPKAAGGEPVSREALEIAIDRIRFAFSLDEDMKPFFDAFKRDPLLGPVIRAKPWIRARRRPWPWEALAWAITKQLIESSRAAEIERRILRRWGVGLRGLIDVPGPEAVSKLAPAELVACDLTEARSLAMLRCAREVAAGRIDLDDPADDRRLLAIPEIGPWTVQCLGLDGRGEADSLPAGDLAYIKLVGRLAGLGRRATIEEVEEFFAPYEPHRGIAGMFVIVGLHKTLAQGPPLRMAA